MSELNILFRHDSIDGCPHCNKAFGYIDSGISDGNGSDSEWHEPNFGNKREKAKKEFSFAHSLSPEIVKSSRIVENIRKNFHQKYCQALRSDTQACKKIKIENAHPKIDKVLYQSPEEFNFETPAKQKVSNLHNYSFEMCDDSLNIKNIQLSSSGWKDDSFKKNPLEFSLNQDHKSLTKKFLDSVDFSQSKGTKETNNSTEFKLQSLDKLKSYFESMGIVSGADYLEIDQVHCSIDSSLKKPKQAMLPQSSLFDYEAWKVDEVKSDKIDMLAKWQQHTLGLYSSSSDTKSLKVGVSQFTFRIILLEWIYLSAKRQKL